MDEQELARLVVRLLGESSSFTKTFEDAKKQIEDQNKVVEEGSKSVDKATGKLNQLAAAGAAAFGSFQAFDFLKESEAMYKEAATAERQLVSILKIQGREVDTLTERYKDLGEELMKKLGVDDDGIVAMAKQAELMGVTGEAAERAIKNAHALAAAHGGVADSYLRQTIMLENGKVGRLGILLGMGELEDGADKAAEAQSKLNKMWEFAEAEGQTYSSRLKRQESELGNLRESYGKIVKEGIQPFREAMLALKDEAIKWLDGMSDSTKKYIVQGIALAGAFAGIAGGLAAIVAMKVAILGVLSAIGSMMLLLATNPFVIWTAAIVATFLALRELGKAMSGVGKEMEKLNELAKERADMDTKVGSETAKRTAAELKELSMLPLKEQQLKLLERRARLEKEINEATGRVSRRKEEVEAERGPARRAREALIGEDPTLHSLRSEVKEAESSLSRLKYTMEAIKKAKMEVDKELNKPVGGPLLTFTLNMVGAAAATTQIMTDSEEYARSLQLQSDTFGMTARQVKIYELALAGASDEMLHASQFFDGLLTAMEADAKLTEQGTQLKKDMATPLEKYNAKMEELNELLQKNKIDQDTFNRAAEDAQKTLDAGTNSVKMMNMELQRLDATLSGGAEAKARIASFKAMVEGDRAADRAGRNAAGPPITNTTQPLHNDVQAKWLEKIYDLMNKQGPGLDIDPTDFDT